MHTADSTAAQRLVFACNGGEHCGQAAARAAAQLERDGYARQGCLAGLAAARPQKLAETREARKRIVLDGCEEHCGRRILDAAAIPIDLHLVATKLGVGKSPRRPHVGADGERVAEAALAALTG
jgi:uncharacterized metal-binding protein